MHQPLSLPAANAVRHPGWARHASLYEVNVRQFSAAGTLAAVQAQLPRLQALGVGILWFMPIQPIGVKNRKGGLGSYYSIRDYTAVNPEFGTLEDFRRLVQAAHAAGMKVILDWVANHTAWDHPWVHRHPDWYKKNEKGEIHAYTYRASPTAEPEYWTDVVGLDYARPTLWPAMTDAMLWWLRETDIDGFRCDVASLVPTPFWDQARAALDRVKPVFMLAESDAPDLHRHAFDLTYDWKLYDTLKAVAKGQGNAANLRQWWQQRQTKYGPDDWGMNFTGNHDTNSWHGSDLELYGSQEAFKAMAVLAATLPGMPLVYSGQESFLPARLAFFEKDAIRWGGYELAPLYADLLALKRTHPALANGQEGGAPQFHDVGNEAVCAFTRERRGRALQVVVNLSANEQACTPPDGAPLRLAPWSWRLRSS